MGARSHAGETIDVLIPTRDRPAALAVTLAGLAAQTESRLRIVISDQSESQGSIEGFEVTALRRVLELHGIEIESHHHLPRRGMAEQRAFLLSKASSPFVLFLDDDLLLEPDVISRMLLAIRTEECGFVGCAPIGLSYRTDERPGEQSIELWNGKVRPERVVVDGPGWNRHLLHNAANVLHVQRSLPQLKNRPYVAYKVAWTGGCVLFRRDALLKVGGFDFWPELPVEHAGEDVLAQLRVMERFGGCGVLPSGVYHLELPTSVPCRAVDAPRRLPLCPRFGIGDGGIIHPRRRGGDHGDKSSHD